MSICCNVLNQFVDAFLVIYFWMPERLNMYEMKKKILAVDLSSSLPLVYFEPRRKWLLFPLKLSSISETAALVFNSGRPSTCTHWLWAFLKHKLDLPSHRTLLFVWCKWACWFISCHIYCKFQSGKYIQRIQLRAHILSSILCVKLWAICVRLF